MKYVFFHGNCFDGFGAAFAAWKKLGNEAKYIPQFYGKEHVMDTPFNPEDEVYIVDYSVSNEEFEKLANTVSKVVILDHHKTALERFTGLSPYPDPRYFHAADGVYVDFNMDESGALITWKYFHPEKPVPMLIQWVSDRDLWQFKLSSTKPVHALLTSKKMDFAVWDELMKIGESAPQSLVDTGSLLLSQQDQTVDMILKKAYMTKIAGYTVPVVNASSHWSEVGNKLVDLYPGYPFAASYTDQPDGTRMYSLRSNDKFDVSAIAQLFGGGGHKQASGFKVQIDLQLPQLLPDGK